MIGSMSHTYHLNLAHVVFHAGRRLIRKCDLVRLHAYIASLARDYRVQLPVVGGVNDHIHLLGNFPMDKSPSAIVGAIKANSSRWLKTINGHYSDFAWQEGYGYFSVSASIRADVVRYIQNQPNHHSRETASEEFDRMIRIHETAINACDLRKANEI